jgi:hypothetical protein
MDISTVPHIITHVGDIPICDLIKFPQNAWKHIIEDEKYFTYKTFSVIQYVNTLREQNSHDQFNDFFTTYCDKFKTKYNKNELASELYNAGFSEPSLKYLLTYCYCKRIQMKSYIARYKSKIIARELYDKILNALDTNNDKETLRLFIELIKESRTVQKYVKSYSNSHFISRVNILVFSHDSAHFVYDDINKIYCIKLQ